MEEEDLEHSYDNVLRLGMKSARSFDLYGEERTATVYYFKNGTIGKNFHIRDAGISFRINEGGRTGFSGCSLDLLDPEKLIQDASPSLHVPSDLIYLDFPKIERNTVEGIYDNNIAAMSCEQIEEMVQSVMASASHAQVSSMDGYVRLYAKKWIIGNCHGETATVEETYIRILLRVHARLLFKTAMHVEYQDGRTRAQISPEHVGESCSERAVKSLKHRKMSPENLPVVLDPSIVSNLAYSLTREMLNAGNISRKISCLNTDSRLGSITLSDHGTIAGGLRSSPVDGEGVKKGEQCLIREGRVVSYLHNLATGDKFKTPSTGNCGRIGYAVKPAIVPSTLIIEPGDSHTQEIIEETKRGIYFGLSFDVPHIANGDYFLTAQNAFWIENGEIGEPVQFPGINTTIFTFFDSVDLVSRDTVVLNGVFSPTMRLSTMRVVPSPVTFAGALPW